jgi:N-acetylglucosamine-6-phosphate deacetylase
MKNGALIFYNGTVILPDREVENGIVVCRGGRIEAVGDAEQTAMRHEGLRVDARGGYIVPGYIDIHVHGGAGADFMDGTEAAIKTVTQAHGRHGTTSIFPTTTTGTPEQIDAMLRACRNVQRDWRIEFGARVAGVHFYGPYFAADKVGCHPLHGRRDPDPNEYSKAFDLGIVRIATCAAEIPGAAEYYREAQRRGYFVTCGHSNASWSEMAAAFELGMRHVDHFWCAMSSIDTMRKRFGTPMQGSMEQFVLLNREMSTEVIADGAHLSAELLEFAYRMKGATRLCLVTDANRGLGMPPGEYYIGPTNGGEIFYSDGKVGHMANGGLCSSVVGMETMVKNMKSMTSASLVEVIRMATLTPAERVGVAAEIGSLEAGKRADILVLDRHLNVRRVFMAGLEYPLE